MEAPWELRGAGRRALCRNRSVKPALGWESGGSPLKPQALERIDRSWENIKLFGLDTLQLHPHRSFQLPIASGSLDMNKPGIFSIEGLKSNWVKALLVLSCLLLGCADLVTTNVILDLGMGELNPFMRLAQTWLGVWWLIPKLGLTFLVTWLLWRSKNVYNVALVVAFCSTPVLNNLILIIAGTS